MIKTIIFDFGGVIVPLEFPRAYAALAHRCPYTASEIPTRIGRTDLVRRFESGQIDMDLFVKELSDLLGLKVEFNEFCRIWNSIFCTESSLPDNFFKALRQRYRVLLLSNTNILHFQLLRNAFPLLDNFDGFVLSYEVGAMKPDPKIYRAALDIAHCSAEECFFTDDIATYVEAARELGIDAVQFESFEQLQNELRSRKVIWD